MRLPNGSGVKREFHAPFCERLAGKFCWSTLPPLTEDDITKIFDKGIARHVEGLTRVKPYGKISAEESLNLLIQQKKHDTALIKIFDRVHNIQTLGIKSPEKIQKIIKETLKSFITLAVYLAIPKIEQQFYQLCFQVLNKTPLIERTFLSYDINLPLLVFQNDFYRNNS